MCVCVCVCVCGISLPVKHNVMDENVKLQTEVTYVLNVYCLFKINVNFDTGFV